MFFSEITRVLFSDSFKIIRISTQPFVIVFDIEARSVEDIQVLFKSFADELALEHTYQVPGGTGPCDP